MCTVVEHRGREHAALIQSRVFAPADPHVRQTIAAAGRVTREKKPIMARISRFLAE